MKIRSDRSTTARLFARGLLLLAAVCVSMTATSAAWAQRQDRGVLRRGSPRVLSAFRDAVSRPGRSTVRVLCDGKDSVLGTVVGADGWILTKASELKGDVACKLADGRELDAKVIGVHEDFDLAMLKIDARGLKVVDWADSSVAPVGNWVASVGTGEEPVAVGVVSVAARKVSGRALAMAKDSGGYLGIGLDPGAKINEVIPGSGADKAGLKAQDTIVAVAGKTIEDSEALLNVLHKYKPGDEVNFRVQRGDKELDIKATLGKRPASMNRGESQNLMGSDLSDRRTGFPMILQHDSVLKPRDCGGPLVDLDGKVVGINIARAGRTESYAVPSEAIRPLLKDLESGKLAPKTDTADKDTAKVK